MGFSDTGHNKASYWSRSYELGRTSITIFNSFGQVLTHIDKTLSDLSDLSLISVSSIVNKTKWPSLPNKRLNSKSEISIINATLFWLNPWGIQLFQKTTLSVEKQKVFKPRLQGNVGCFKSVFCWQTITQLNWSMIFIRHSY